MTQVVWGKEQIQSLLERSDKAVVKALHAIYERQLPDEKAGFTREVNGVGFSKFDAPFLCDIVQGYKRWGRLTPKQMAITRNKMKRYWRQLVDIANTKAVEAGSEAAQPVGMVNTGTCDCEWSDGEPCVACRGPGKCLKTTESHPDYGRF